MDTNKWKSVLVQKPMYEEILTCARVEGRTISGQLRVVFDTWKEQNLTNKDLVFLRKETDARKRMILEEKEKAVVENLSNITE